MIGPPSRPDADMDYSFGQVAVTEALVDYRSNCRNISFAVGPFALDEDPVAASGSEAAVRIHVSRFALDGGEAAVEGDFELSGVFGRGARIRFEFLDPAGAVTGRLLPTGAPLEILDVPELGRVEASLIDPSTPRVFVNAGAVGLEGMESPHRAVPLTGVMCLAVAARITGRLVHRLARPPAPLGADLRVAPPPGLTTVAAAVKAADGCTVQRVVLYRTARRLMEGAMLVPASRAGRR